jgi:hypothetical protein
VLNTCIVLSVKSIATIWLGDFIQKIVLLPGASI